VAFSQKGVFVRVDRPPVAVVFDAPALLVLGVHKLLRLREIVHHLVVNIDFQSLVLH
jgi:hypothetical protein